MIANGGPPEWFCALCRDLGCTLIGIIFGSMLIGHLVNNSWEKSAIVNRHGTYTLTPKGHTKFTWLVPMDHQNPATSLK